MIYHSNNIYSLMDWISLIIFSYLLSLTFHPVCLFICLVLSLPGFIWGLFYLCIRLFSKANSLGCCIDFPSMPFRCTLLLLHLSVFLTLILFMLPPMNKVHLKLLALFSTGNQFCSNCCQGTLDENM